eukprot:8083533-Pyramimonas_sp.AAC.1
MKQTPYLPVPIIESVKQLQNTLCNATRDAGWPCQVEKLKSGMPKALFDIFARSTVEFHEFASAWVEAGMGVACVCVKVDVAEYLETKRR